MSESPAKNHHRLDGRAERVARYKEERKRQLANQFAIHNDRRANKDGSSSSEGPRTTKASRLRAAAAAVTTHENGSSLTQVNKLDSVERAPAPAAAATASSSSSGGGCESRLGGGGSGSSRGVERDKSSKRKSNLNRALNSEEVPQPDFEDDAKTRRRRRRFFPSEVLEQSPKDSSSNDDRFRSDTNLATSSVLSSPATSTLTASTSSSASKLTTPKKSELRIHMENARRGVTPSYSEMGRYKPAMKKTSSSNNRDRNRPHPSGSDQEPVGIHSDKEINGNTRLISVNRENKKRNLEIDKKITADKGRITPNSDESGSQRQISKKMEELRALTKDTLARVERLASKARESPRLEMNTRKSISPLKQVNSPRTNTRVFNIKSDSKISLEKTMPSSILKKKSVDESVSETPPVQFVSSAVPVSILKRKVSQDEHSRHEGSATHTPPVTFSPNVVEPATTNRKQGILKKRRSLDESQVMRHRSCSPDVPDKSDSRSILKNQRRSSMEELTRIDSPEAPLQGILKRKSSRCEEEDHSLNSPQSILKRRSGASSAGSVNNTPHVSITTAVILAAAGGAEMVLEPQAEFRPILKKKSFSEDASHSDYTMDVPKPILKKKSSTDTDEYDDKPKKTILKIPKGSADRDFDALPESRIKHTSCDNNDCDVRPILKQNTSREDSPRPRLSFCEENSTNTNFEEVVLRQKRRSHTICSDFTSLSPPMRNEEEERMLQKARPLSVSELVMSFEKNTSISSTTGAIPKRSSLKRNSDRYRTQPVTYNELEASLHYVHSPHHFTDGPVNHRQSFSSPTRPLDHNTSVQSLLDFTSSLENDSNLNSFLSTASFNHSILSTDNEVCNKMSSDSAFQSLGDGLELEQEEENIPETSLKPTQSKLEPSKLELQMKAIADEAKNMRLGKGSSGIQKYRNRKTGGTTEKLTNSRYSTQPVTFEEVQEATRVNKADEDDSGDDADPCNLSLSERIKMFNTKTIMTSEERPPRRAAPPRRTTRFQTQPVTCDEVELARRIPSATSYALDGLSDKSSEKRGILKSNDTSSFPKRDSTSPVGLPRSALKRRDSFNKSPEGRRPVFKAEIVDTTHDEGISCNDSASDSEVPTGNVPPPAPYKKYASRSSENVGKGVGRSSSCVSDIRRSGKSSSGDNTSDGESSGGREIRSIFRNEKQLKLKAALESCLSKSKSQNNVRDDSEETTVPVRKNVTVRRSQTHVGMPRGIAELQAKLQQRGETEWKKRVPQNNPNDEIEQLLREKNKYNDELSEKSILAAKKDELDASIKQWRERVTKSDADNFSVAGRMEKNGTSLTINIPNGDKEKRTPQAKRFKGKEGSDSSSTPVSPEKGNGHRHDFRRTQSVCDTVQKDTSVSEQLAKPSPKKVLVSRPDDDTFKNFYKSNETSKVESQHLELSLDDLDAVSNRAQSLLVHKKNIQVQKRRGATKNPIKALASRTDIQNEYTEVLTGAADREMKRLNLQKLSKLTNNLAVEALAGLASNEDFTSVALKKSTGPTVLLPYKDLMLIQIKGRRHVQTRLVEPVVDSINEGDNFILVTPKVIYNYTGAYSNVIEQSRAADIANHIQQKSDLGCKASRIININRKTSTAVTKEAIQFWQLLGATESQILAGAGHPDEDEIFESNILNTNMIYEIDGSELVPLDEYWGSIPKIDMLQADKVYVFDFGTEMYVWSGKNAKISQKKLTLKLAQDLWDEGYNYSECNVCPINVAGMLGDRQADAKPSLKGEKRPDWSLFAKLTQYRETILFKEKFLDWPDFSRIIKVKDDENEKQVDPSYDLKPCNVKEMLKLKSTDIDLEVEGNHLGRGDRYYDEESHRLFEFDTLDITMYRILENTYEKLPDENVGHFYDCDSYIIRWHFRMTVKGRELSGKPSKYAQTGRDRSIYFCWQGCNASINEKGTAAFLTVELDHESAPQIRVVQGAEPPAFLRLFRGKMIIHEGKRDSTDKSDRSRLFIVRGEFEDEACLLEVPCEKCHLRSRSSMLLVNGESEEITVWHGAKASKQTRNAVKHAADRIVEAKPGELGLKDAEDVEITEIEEGNEDDEFLNMLVGDRNSYVSLKGSKESYAHTLRLFHLTSLSGTFEANEIHCGHRSEDATPYPFLQNDLYSSSQPALFLIDNHHELWLWQGWWPERDEDSETEANEQTGSGAVRWHAERRAAMQTAVNYWKESHPDDDTVPGFLVWAGLEPIEFKNLFPTWEDHQDVAELNIKEGKSRGETKSLEKELAQLSRTTYPLSELLKRPLPDGVDPTQIEIYLSSEDFQELLCMTKEEFQKLPSWKKTTIKKEKGLF